ncbi:MAG: hypothetical protein HQ596_07165 [Candidatus Saganbacteria bacterium]|nr:hypothetical protein [Candidatus Saganbacteria bacterium]
MRTSKHLIYFIILSLALMPLCTGAFAKTTTWDGKVSIKNETSINEGDTVNVMPQTTINFENENAKLLISGNLIIEGSENNPATIVIPNFISGITPTPIHQKTILELNEGLQTLEIFPYTVDTQEIKDELKAFRIQYAIVWTTLMVVNFYLVLNRTAYW